MGRPRDEGPQPARAGGRRLTGPIQVGLIGYGLAGAVFHAPLIRAVERLALAAIATTRPVPAGATRVFRDPLDLIADPIPELVVIATPNESHFPLARAALLAGKHVVVDKPFTVSVEEADALIALAGERDRLLSVFHNRRWDGDFLTVRDLIGAGRLGEIMLFEARWDRFRPAIKQGWREIPAEGAGLLSDLGPHLIDQALALFGLPEAVTGDLAAQRAEARVDDYFELALHYGARRVLVSAATLVAAPRPRFAAHGTRGTFVKTGVDPQEAALKSGRLPTEPGFGAEDPAFHGILTLPEGTTDRIPTRPGCYRRFYEDVAAAILDGAPVPVDPADAREGLRIIALARQSAREGRTLRLR